MSEARSEPAEGVTVYWRKRCPYCVRLRWQLRRVGLPTRERNIWKDKAAAARVRAITGGDETVPTVVVGSRSMVNPTIEQLLAEVRAQAPHLLERAGRGNGLLLDRLAALLGPVAAWRYVVTGSLPRRRTGRGPGARGNGNR